MKKFQILLAIVAIMFFATNCFAKLSIKTYATPTQKLRFTSNNQYVASFICNLSSKELNYKRMNKLLSTHFSEEAEKEVSGLIWENGKEGPEIMIQILKTNGIYIGNIRISLNNFVHDGNFYYRIGELKVALENAFGFEITLSQFREKGDNSRQKYTIEGGDFLTLEI